ncbi:MAG: branched-chain amino acid ABC transporter ATP-binding protein/permease [Rhodospirillales bacterium]|nr:branched-chain amino acid ABC transporter ATP-binding protein/permease [Rhodospirillales bacterium]
MTGRLLSGINPALAFGLVVLVVWPMAFDTPYGLRLFALAGIYAIFVMGYQFVFGHAGALSLCHGTFFGLGAYFTGILGAKFGWGFPATFAASALAPVVLAAIVAAPVLRLESHYFALATLGIAQVMLLVAIKWEAVTGGANGIAGVPPIVLFGMTLARGWPTVLIVWGLVAALGLAARAVLGGLYGHALHVMRENPTAAMSLGLDVARLRFETFLLSALYAGLAGALYVHTIRVISPEALEFHAMVACLTMTVVGGRTRLAGAILGAVLLIHLPEWFRFLEHYYLIAYGLVLLATIIVAPNGLLGLVEDARRRLAPEAPPPAPFAMPLPAAARPTVPTGAILSLDGVGKRFGGLQALDAVSFDVRPGEILGLIGPNGSGKTTLVNCITGIYTPDGGGIRIAGTDVGGMPAHEIARLGVARTFQNLNLVDEMSALDNVAIARGAARHLALGTQTGATAMALARAEAMGLLEAVGAAEVAMRPCGGLAYGTKRRIEIARALALQPTLLLLDEPAAGLNESEQADLAQRLKALAGSGLTLVVIEHNMPFLLPLATRLVCLDHGQKIAEGSPRDVARNAKVVEAYLGPQEAAEVVA